MKNPTLTLTHSEANRGCLLAFSRKIPGAYIGIKVAALLLILEGQRPGWIIEVLGLTRQSLNQWMHKVNEEGLKGLQPKAKSGRPCQLNPKTVAELEHHLEKSPLDFGINRVQWDGPTLATHLKRHFGVKVKVRQAQYWLHRLGYRLKSASYSYLQSRKEEARRFQRALKKTSNT